MLLLQKIKYHEPQWVICVDFKIVNLLFGQQSSHIKYPCILCPCIVELKRATRLEMSGLKEKE